MRRIAFTFIAALAIWLAGGLASAQMMLTGAGGSAQAAPVLGLNVRNGCNSGPAAVGNGVSDDSAAFVACINAALSSGYAGSPAVLYVPAGIYLIKANALPLMRTYGVAIKGDENHKTFIKIDPAYAGDVFAWNEAWMNTAFSGNFLDPTQDVTGASVEDITVVGSLNSSNIQNAFVFYDRNDHVYFRNVSVYFLNGACLKMGYTLHQPQAYMRESNFYGLKCVSTGTANIPSVEISSFTANGSDATNELQFFGLAISQASGIGLSVHNPNVFSATRLMHFFGLRVEGSGADDVDIGAPGDLGSTNSIKIYGFQGLSPGKNNAGFFALNLGLGTVQDYEIEVFGATIGPCIAAVTCSGLKVDNVRLTKVEVGNIATTGPNVTYTSRVGADVVLDAAGLEASFTYSVPGTVTVPTWRTFTP